MVVMMRSTRRGDGDDEFTKFKRCMATSSVVAAWREMDILPHLLVYILTEKVHPETDVVVW
jgi:hypothetical protein